MKTFSQLRSFNEFYDFAKKHLTKDERLYKKTLLERQTQKQGFLAYNSQIGKLKGL